MFMKNKTADWLMASAMTGNGCRRYQLFLLPFSERRMNHVNKFGMDFFHRAGVGTGSKKGVIAAFGWYDGSRCGDGSLSTGDFG